MIVVLDIGGTKIRATSSIRQAGGLEIQRKEFFETARWSDFPAFLKHFIGADKGDTVEAIAIGIAAPVMKWPIHLTNLDWTLDAEEIKKFAPNAEIFVMNDLIAHAWGVSLLSDGDVEVIHRGTPRAGGHRAVVAAGTGLGMAILTRQQNNQWLPLASEGGHASFGPRSEREMSLLHFLMKRYGGHVSWERVVSGKYGFRNIADFLFSTGQYGTEQAFMESLGDLQDIAGQIAKGAIEENLLAKDTLRLFCGLYGSATGNLALMSLATDGIYLTGGISRKISSWLHRGEFMDGFTAMGRMREILEQMPIYLVTNPDLASLGLGHYVEIMSPTSPPEGLLETKHRTQLKESLQ